MIERLRVLPIWVIAFVISAAFHEFAHAWTAHKLGDDTAARMGRLTVNPLPHIDPVGIILLVLTVLMTPFGIGWAKPVPVNPYNFRHPRRDYMLVALSGPVSNIILIAIFTLLFRLFPSVAVGGNPLGLLLAIFLLLNVILAVFNLIPVHPLDGSHIVEGILPENLVESWTKTYRYGFIILLILIFTGLLSRILKPIFGFVSILIGMPGLF